MSACKGAAGSRYYTPYNSCMHMKDRGIEGQTTKLWYSFVNGVWVLQCQTVSVSVYLFAIRSTRERTKEKKSFYLDSHGEEAQMKPGLKENGLPQINN